MPSQRARAAGLAIVLSAALLGTAARTPPQAATAAPIAAVTGDPRVDGLLARMTADEKLALIRGTAEPAATNQGQAGYLGGVPRLGIPPLRLSDGPPGVLTRLPSQAETATMGLAATFSVGDAEANGQVIAREAKALGIDLVLEPFINIDRDIAAGRSYNTFGEDPVLTGAIGAAEIRGIQGLGVMAQAKHYLGYDAGAANVVIGDQALHEVYVAPFAQAVAAGVSSIMCSYNTLNGVPACGNRQILTWILRDELGFRGFVTSDWGANHAPGFLQDGLDMEIPGVVDPAGPMAAFMVNYFSFAPAPATPPPSKAATAKLMGMMMGSVLPEEPPPLPFPMGAIDPSKYPRRTFYDEQQAARFAPADLDRAAGRVLYQMNRFGLLDHPPTHQPGPHDVAANAAVIEQTGIDAAVLLKNDGNILPLSRDRLAALAMIGPGAGQVVAIGTAGERSVGFVDRQVGPVRALQQLAPGSSPMFAVADDMTGRVVQASALSSQGKPGLRRTDATGQHRTDAVVDFTQRSGMALPPGTTATWDGTLTVPVDGVYWINLELLGAAGALTIDGHQVAAAGSIAGAMQGDTVLAGKDGLLPTTDGLDNARAAASLAAGAHPIRISVHGDLSGAPAQVRLAWTTPQQRAADRATALEAAKAAKVVVVFAWTRGNPVFALPGDQDRLIEDIAAVNPNTVVVLNVSQPVAMPWLNQVKAVLNMWWPGDEGGWATAKLLLGTADPAGRLPFSWARQITDYAPEDPAHPERADHGVHTTTTFSEGVDVGYRWFDRQGTAPMFPFGYGLSYTRFAYSGLQTKPAADGGLDVSFTLRNTGGRDGDEVAQLYLGAPSITVSGAVFPLHALAGFARVGLRAGAATRVAVHVAARQLQYWDSAAQQWQRPHGAREILVGPSSRVFALRGRVGGP